MLARKNTILALAVITTGLTAGLFYAYSVSINPAFTHLSDAEYITAMQAINKAIENPVFFFSFMGAALFLPLATFMHRDEKYSKKFKLLLTATVLYLVGAFGVTIAANVPMNEKLVKFSVDSSSTQQITDARTEFTEPWNTWHSIRTVAAIAAFIAAIGASLSVRDRTNIISKKENL